MEKTMVMIKPDGVRRHMIGHVILAIESRGLIITQLHMKTLSWNEAGELYSEHKGKWHFERNIRHVSSGPVVLVEVIGDDAVNKCRDIVEHIRRQHTIELPQNLVHATSDVANVEREISAVGLDIMAEIG